MTQRIAIVIIIASIICPCIQAKLCLAPTPPMGWNSWNCVGHDVTEELIMGIADAMVESGMKDAGYEYVVIDDMWHLGRVNPMEWSEGGNFTTVEKITRGRDENGTLLADPNKFPNGIKYVADYVHSKGLKFGLYTVPGTRTCAGCTGSEGYEMHDVQTFADWGVDFIKLDHCRVKGDVREVMEKWREALDSVDRPIVLSVNMGITDWMGEYADMWRTTTDIMGIWRYKRDEFHLMAGISDIIDLQAGIENLHGPCGYNDPDMLQVGNWDLTEDENKAHFSIWAIFGAPIIAGNDLRKMSESTREILTNEEVIAIDQDPLCYPGRKIEDYKPGLQIYAKRLQNPGKVAVVLLNRTEQDAEITLQLKDVGIQGQAFIRDLWQHKDLGLFSDSFTATVAPHGVVMITLDAFEVIGDFVLLPLIPANGTVIEPEDDEQYIGGAYIKDELDGYTGSGYVTAEEHTWRAMEIVLLTPRAETGKYRFDARYANATDNILKYSTSVNRTGGPVLEFQPTEGEWQVQTWEAQLVDGVNQLRLTSTDCKSSNYLMLDHIKISPVK